MHIEFVQVYRSMKQWKGPGAYSSYGKVERGVATCRMAHTECVSTKGTGSVHYMNSHLCLRVAGGVRGQAVAAVLFQNREEGSCFCTGWISSTQHSLGRSPEEEDVGRERGESSKRSTTTCVSTFCLPTSLHVMRDYPGLSSSG